MNLDLFGPTMGLLERALDVRAVRHAVVSGNVANADTPGYRPVDIDFKEAMGRAVERMGMLRTHARHLSVATEIRWAEHFVREVPGARPGPDGNAVSLEREVARFEENAMLYEATIQTTARKLAMLRYAASGQ